MSPLSRVLKRSRLLILVLLAVKSWLGSSRQHQVSRFLGQFRRESNLLGAMLGSCGGVSRPGYSCACFVEEVGREVFRCGDGG